MTTYEIARLILALSAMVLVVISAVVAWVIRVERRLAEDSASLAGLKARLDEIARVQADLLGEWKGMQCDLTEIRTKLDMHNSEGNPARQARLEAAYKKSTATMPVAVKG